MLKKGIRCLILFVLLTSGVNGQILKQWYARSFVPLNSVTVTDQFWLPRIKTIQQVTINHGFEKCDAEGRFENFFIAGGIKEGTTRGKMPFDDTDVYKIIEGASYSLITNPNDLLDKYLDSIIAIIAIGQEPDGYLTTWLTIDSTKPPAWWVDSVGGRWVREQSSHELYNSGHLFEAAVAHYLATGKKSLLDIALKNADLLVKTFGYGKITIPPGHQIVETGLLKLYAVTGKEEYRNLAKFFLDIRGDSTTHTLFGPYSQDHKPVVQQSEIVGHAVRAVYMYASMTDIAALYNDNSYLNAVMKIWENMVTRRMYVTGGIGARHEGESVGDDYELPNKTAYSETCASIGNVYWNARLFQLTGNAKFFNVIERILYNALLAGISYDGTKFFYVNPLEADTTFAFNYGYRTRQPWFDCSCCPTNLMRFLPSLPSYSYAQWNDTLYVNLYLSNKATITLNEIQLQVEQSTSYPWDGSVSIKLLPQQSSVFTLKLRIPSWTTNEVLPGDLYAYLEPQNDPIIITVNGKKVSFKTTDGYIELTQQWKKNDVVRLYFPMRVRRIVAHELITENKNHTVLEYGPFVYCVEGIDHKEGTENITLPKNVVVKPKHSELFGGLTILQATVSRKDKQGKMLLTAIPYYAWANRGLTTMKVWLPVE